MAEMGSAVLALFSSWAESGKAKAIRLLNARKEPVGAVYLDKVDLGDVAVGESGTSERYFLLSSGVAVLFTYYSPIERG